MMRNKVLILGLFLVLSLFLFGLKSVNADCTDTDGGVEPFVFGTATAVNSGWTSSASDSCIISGTYAGQVNETYCVSRDFGGTIYYWVEGQPIKCGRGYFCSGGACVEDPNYVGAGSPVFKKVQQKSPTEGSSGLLWLTIFGQLIIIALLFYIISKVYVSKKK